MGLWLLSLFFQSPIKAEEQIKYTGFSAFAAFHPEFPCLEFLSISAKASYPATAVLVTTFGYDTKCVKRYLDRFKNRPHFLEIHTSNETFRRNLYKATKFEIAPTLGVRAYNQAIEKRDAYLLRRVRAKVKWVNKHILPLTNANSYVVLSTGLEDNYSKRAYRIIRNEIKKLWKGDLVRNPLHIPPNCRDTDGVKYCELHLPESDFGKVPCIWNNDGNYDDVFYQSEFFTRYSSCTVRLAWSARAQGIFTNQFVEPRRRTFEISRRDITEYGELLSSNQ